MATRRTTNNVITTEQFIYEPGKITDMQGGCVKMNGSLIKWYQIKMTYEEKYRFGLLTYPEYLEWVESLKTTPTTSDTFWKNDQGERTNVSNEDYQSFLAENSIDVSNTTTLDMDDILELAEQASEDHIEPDYVPSESDIDEVLKNVNKDIHGETFLSQEEIDAMFAAANN